MERRIHEQIIRGKVHDLHLSESEIYVDNEARERSGHMSHAMVDMGGGRFMVFNSNCTQRRADGHSAYGFIEYRISEDYCRTFGEIRELPYAKKCLMDGRTTISVEKAVACEDGTVVALCLRNHIFTELCCEPWDSPMVVRSTDGGESWEPHFELCPHKGRVYDARYHKGVIYVLEFCNEHFLGTNAKHVYRLYASHDQGRTFEEVCIVPFENTHSRGYGAMIFNERDELIVYAYNAADEVNMDYIVSPDYGKSWTRSGKSHVAKKIRNPQINILDGQFILHGRAGAGAGFVMYTSADGIDWDEGVSLDTTKPSCYYSNNIIVREEGQPERMLIQFSELYRLHLEDACVNVMHAWLTSVK